MSRRLNLFRELADERPGKARRIAARTQKPAPAGRRPVSLAWPEWLKPVPEGVDPHAAGAVFLVAVASLLIGTRYLSTSRQAKALEARIGAAEREVSELTALAASRVATKETAAATRPSGLDGTWTPLLWELASNTGAGILIERIELTEPAEKRREVKLIGQARSVGAIKGWLERLLALIPGYDFVMENQDAVPDAGFPVHFQVTARST